MIYFKSLGKQQCCKVSQLQISLDNPSRITTSLVEAVWLGYLSEFEHGIWRGLIQSIWKIFVFAYDF